MNPKDWLKDKQTATAEDLSNDIWVRIERMNRALEKYGRGDFVQNMPVLFAMYYYTVVTVMQIPETPTGMELQRIYQDNVHNLDDECLIEEGQAEEMIHAFQDACQKIADAYVAEKQDESREFNPFRAIVHEGARLLELPYNDIHVEIVQHLADFAVSYRVGNSSKKIPFKA